MTKKPEQRYSIPVSSIESIIDCVQVHYPEAGY